ncbi:MAG: hypothetical protein JWM34_1485 [Ilumatobacteraceae bacterium]|nr:hypothetical protein [Ilumatobacteraceae bacterium]
MHPFESFGRSYCILSLPGRGADHVGPRATPLGPTEAVTFAVWGTNGNCTIPNTATGIATNVTAVNPTSASYVTVYPSDANPRPTASNLNVVAGGAPTPNQVTVGLSAAGAISAYNNGGTLDLVIDIVGYYQPAASGGGVVDDDARYYTKPQVDASFAGVNATITQVVSGIAGLTSSLATTNAAVATKATKQTGSRSVVYLPPDFAPETDGDTYGVSEDALVPTNNASSCFATTVVLPDGATVTQLTATVSDSSSTWSTSVALETNTAGLNSSSLMAHVGTGTGATPGAVTLTTATVTHPVIDNETNGYDLQFCGDPSADYSNATLTYTLP